tara:strand:+ start:5539 stop:5883 length:345 start_codon:yes stop_codon:yes gene_type:complete
MSVPPEVAGALNQYAAWKDYQHRFRGSYGQNPLGAKRLGTFVKRYRAMAQRVARNRAKGKGPKGYPQPQFLDPTIAANRGAGYTASDEAILGRGRYRLKGRGRYTLRGRGKSQL